MFGAHPMFRIGGGAGYQIPYSLRFRASNSAYLQRTPAGAGNRKTWTWSAWVKRGTLGGAVAMNLFVGDRAGGTDATYTSITFTPSDQLAVGGAVTNWRITTAVFRDPTAWLHIVVALDTTQATAGDRVKVYVNGTQVTAFGTSNNPALNADLGINQAALHALGRDVAGGPTFFDGYMAEVNFIDGQALTPSSFGQTDSATGVWVPKKYSGTYGSNGFYLKFNDATTTTTIGNDSSGNANNWTTSGISVTSGVTFDQMLDTPTLNYATFSQIDQVGGTNTLSASIDITTSASVISAAIGTFWVSSGKWYFEFTPSSVAGQCQIGIAASPVGTISTNGPGQSANAYVYASSGQKGNNNSFSAYGATFAASDVIGVALDLDAGTLVFYKNNVSQGTAFSSLTGTFSLIAGDAGNAATMAGSLNCGQRAFSYTPPTGFKALNTQNVTSTAVTVSGSFTGNAAADGPFIWADGNPATLTINGNPVTFGTHADKTAGGFKLRTSSASYNAAGANTWTATAGSRFVQSRRPNNAQVNP